MTDHRAAFQLDRDNERLERVAGQLRRQCGRAPALLVRAPGRVNLLGEHTDYNGLPVLPMAIDRTIIIAAAVRDDSQVNLCNTAPHFLPRHYQLSETIRPYRGGDWGNYSKAAAQCLVRHCDGRLARGADLLIDGNIPAGAGLSSSSALVVGSALALLAANDIDVPYPELAELLPGAERYVGTLSGGMDQATCLLAQAGHALRIDFFPLTVRTVPLPAGYTIVVCHSLVQAEKSGAARLGYNLRVIECRLACRVIDRALGNCVPRGLKCLGDLAHFFPGRPLLDFLSSLAIHVPDRPMPLVEIAAVIGTEPERLRADCQVSPDVGDRFVLLRRTRHVLSEAERVTRAERALQAGDGLAFGQLMDASHASCRDDYEISCPELEELVRIAKDAGAIGARLTGAGFGGCTVNLVANTDVPSFLTRIDRYYYRSRLSGALPLSSCRFTFTPQAGAAVIRL